MVRGRLAPVAFLFEKRGLVRVALEQTDDLDVKVDQLVEAAMDADAEDFEQDEPDDGIVEVAEDDATGSASTSIATGSSFLSDSLASASRRSS